MNWISVKDRLPETNECCLVYRRCELTDWSYPPPQFGLIQEAYYIKKYDTFTIGGSSIPTGSAIREISHWIKWADIPKPVKD